MKRRPSRYKSRRRQGGMRFFMVALGTAVVIVVLIFVAERLFSGSEPGQAARVAGQTPSALTELMPAAAESLAGFQLFLSRCARSPGCPYYALSVNGNTLKYLGVRDVAKRGVVKEPLSADRKRQLLALVRESGFFALDDSYTLGDVGCKTARTDAPTLKIGVKLNGQTKVVIVNQACNNVPPQLVALAQGIDRISHSARWTGVSPVPTAGTGS